MTDIRVIEHGSNMERSEYIKTLTEESVALLKEMVSIPSPSFSESAVCDHISRWLNGKGLEHERIGNNIIAESIHDPKKPTLMLCAHIDTVNASEDYSFNPFTPHYDVASDVISSMTGMDVGPEDIVAGLGSNDDGASVVAMIAAYRYFCSRDSRNNGEGSDGRNNGEDCSGRNLVLVLTCEEERSGRNGMTGLWGSRICSRGEAEARAGAGAGASTGIGAEGCTVADHAIVGEPTGMRIATSERGLLVIDATAHGTSGHAARNEGENALYIALEDIEKLRNHEFGRISSRMGKVNLNVTQINAGTAHNVIPDRCDFVIDIRPTEQYTNEEIMDELTSICRSSLKPRNLANRSSATYEGSLLQKAADDLGIDTFSSPTTSDWMRIRCDAIKMGPGLSSRSHKKDEFVFVSEIYGAIRTYIDFINQITVYEYTLE